MPAAESTLGEPLTLCVLTHLGASQVQPALGHGAVLETIMADINGSQGDRLSAGVAVMKVRGPTYVESCLVGCSARCAVPGTS